jgi:hypothetical protein
MEEQDGKTQVGEYLPGATIILRDKTRWNAHYISNALDGSVVFQEALESLKDTYAALKASEMQVNCNIEVAWELLLANQGSISNEVLAEVGRLLGKKLGFDVSVCITVGYNSDEVGFTLSDVPFGTDLDDLAETIKRNTTLSTSKVNITTTGRLGLDEYTDEYCEVDYEVELDNVVDIEVSCSWE